MGVWIETRRRAIIFSAWWSHTLYGCVDWNSSSSQRAYRRFCHTLYGCVDWNLPLVDVMLAVVRHTLYGCVDWNKNHSKIYAGCNCHTLYGCVDWNIDTYAQCWGVGGSHPVWVCGLKLWRASIFCFWRRHTLYGCVDWNFNFFGTGNTALCHTLYGCVDWNLTCGWIVMHANGHTLYGCVDWNYYLVTQICRYLVTPCMGVWIETTTRMLMAKAGAVTPCMGVWIETDIHWATYRAAWVTPCMGVWIETFPKFAPKLRNKSHTLYGCVDWNLSRLSSTGRSKMSHPVWVCGLKLSTLERNRLFGVTPCMGVWIETSSINI